MTEGTPEPAAGPGTPDSAGVPDTAGEASDTSRKVKILVVSDTSGLGLGGVPVFNKLITEGLGANRDHDVTAFFVSDPAKAQAHGNAKNITLDPDPEPDRQQRKQDREVLEQAVRERSLEELGLEDDYDIVIGHSRFSGPAAQMLAAKMPGAKYVHVLHTDPTGLEQAKVGNPYDDAEVTARTRKGEENARVERETMAHDGITVGVGSLLTTVAEGLQAEGRGDDKVTDIHDLMPGIEVDSSHVPSVPGPGEPVKLLLMGRADDVIKGVGDALEAVRECHERGVQVELTIRGVGDGGRWTDMQTAVNNLVGPDHAGSVTLKGFTDKPEELKDDLREAHVVVMPSKTEGFGLVALEAAAMGVPVIVNRDSGYAQLLADEQRGIAPENAEHSVVMTPPADGPEVTPTESYPDTKPQRFHAYADAIEKYSQDAPQWRERAEGVREALAPFTWKHAGDALVDAVMNRPADAARTKQIAHGMTQSTPRAESRAAAAALTSEPGEVKRTPSAPAALVTEEPVATSGKPAVQPPPAGVTTNPGLKRPHSPGS
jgi:glycosyltransferase involved in cell wall biosynthesis